MTNMKNQQDGLTRRQQMVLEEMLERSVNGWNGVMRQCKEAWPEANLIFEEFDVSEIQFIEGPGQLDDYWQEMSSAGLRGVEEERQRLYEVRQRAERRFLLDAFAIRKLKEKTLSLPSPPEVFGALSIDGQFWEEYLAARAYSFGVPVANRLMLLAVIEYHIWTEGKSPGWTFEELLSSLGDEPTVGAQEKSEMRIQLKELVARLLIEEEQVFQNCTSFYDELEWQHESWNSNGAARKYFKRWLGEKQPADMNGWKALAKWWKFELEQESNTEWVPRT